MEEDIDTNQLDDSMPEEEAMDEAGVSTEFDFEAESLSKPQTAVEKEDGEFEEDESNEPDFKTPALTINIQSWATPIVGIVMLAIGLVAGFYGRSMIRNTSQSSVPEATAVASEPTSTVEVESSSVEQPQQPSDEQLAVRQQALMNTVLAQVRHFRGQEDAPVTLVEFSDFQ